MQTCFILNKIKRFKILSIWRFNLDWYQQQINKPTRITKDTISAIDHLVTNSVINNQFKTSILTADISDHFSILYAFNFKYETWYR